MSNNSLLFLFSSNIRPLYEQDILDVLAGPSGSLYQFRYDERWVDPVARERWLSLEPETPVLVHFSLQQPARYHDPVFFPVRRGTVRRTFREGETLFVVFRLSDFVALAEPSKGTDGRADFASETQRYAAYLAGRSVPRPYKFSAGLGPDLTSDSSAPLDIESDQVDLFERTTKYLQPTDSFRDARFFRFLRLSPRGEDRAVEPDEEGAFSLEGGKSYSLELFHHQPVEVTREDPFLVSVDGAIVRIIGRAGFDIGSRYDRISLPLHAVQSERYESRETVLVVEPAEGVRGPEMRLVLRIEPPSKKMLAGSIGSTLALGVLGSASLLPLQTAWKALLIVAAALTIAVLSFFGLFVSALAGFRYSSLGAGAGQDGRQTEGDRQPS